MLKRSKLYWSLIAGGLRIIVISVFVWNMASPWMANHFGFALPGEGGLPYRVAYGKRDYANLATCARAGWCPDTAEASLCQNKKDLQQLGTWPLIQVGFVPTLLSSPYSLMASQANVANQMTVMGVYVVYKPDCYVPYDLEGGP